MASSISVVICSSYRQSLNVGSEWSECTKNVILNEKFNGNFRNPILFPIYLNIVPFFFLSIQKCLSAFSWKFCGRSYLFSHQGSFRCSKMLLSSHFFKDVQPFEKEKLSEIKHSLQNEPFFRKTKKHCSLAMYHPDSSRSHDPSKVFKIFKNCVPKMEHKNQNLVPYFAGNNPHICNCHVKYHREWSEFN